MFLLKTHFKGDQMLAISVWNRKGGVGKSNTSLNLAGFFASKGKATCLVDLDPQGGSMICASLAEKNGNPLPFEVSRKPNKICEIFIFDHSPGVDSGPMPLAPFVIVPTILDASSYSITLKSINELKEMKKDFLLLPNKVEIQTKEQFELLEQLRRQAEENGTFQPFVRKRIAYPRAYGQGITVFEPKSGLPNSTEAKKEITFLVNVMSKQIAKANEKANANSKLKTA